MTLENYLEKLTEAEVRDLIFAVRRFGGNTGVVADDHNIKFFRKAYADACIERALDSNQLNAAGAFYMQRLQMKLI